MLNNPVPTFGGTHPHISLARGSVDERTGARMEHSGHTSPQQVDVHRELHGDGDGKFVDQEKVISSTPTNEAQSRQRRQPFGAIWIVIACGFALMSDGLSPSCHFVDIDRLRLLGIGRGYSQYDPRKTLPGHLP